MAKQKQTPNTPQPKTKAPEPKPAPATVATTTPPAARRDYLFIIILMAIAFLVNAATIRYNYTLDDPFFTKDNPLVREGTASIPEFFKHAAYYGVFKNHDASYRPLLLISFAIEKEFAGFNPHLSHLINLIIFCLQIMALYLLLRRIFKQYSAFIPFFIVLLFELHPIHTEVVASIKSRDELLALLFTAMCTLQSFKYIDTSKMKHLILSGVYFFIALMAKETPITFVALVPISIYFFRDVKMNRIITACIPYVAVAAVYMMMRAAFIESDGQKVVILVNNNALMAATNSSEKLATALFIQLKYLVLLVLPHPLSWDYSFNQIPIIGLGNPKALLSIVVFGGLLAYTAINIKKKDVFAYCIIFYAASVVITSNIFVDIGATMAERFVYTGSLGFCIAVVFLVARLFKADLTELSYANSAKVFYVLIPIAALYSVKTFARNEVWQSNIALYEDGVITAPESWRTHNLLGVEYTKKLKDEKDPAVKKELFTKAIENFNKSLEVLPGSPEVWMLKGYAYEFAGNDDSAITNYRVAIRLDASAKAASNLGGVYLRRQQLDSAIAILLPIVQRDTTQTDVLTNLAAAYGNKGNFPEALKYYGIAMRKDPNQPPNVLQSMGNIYHIIGDEQKSKYYLQMLKNRPQ